MKSGEDGMSLYDKADVKRTFAIDDLTPEELAALFCDLFGEQQARFFSEVWRIAKDWPGAGWCQQSCEIVKQSDADALDVIKTLAAHLDQQA